MEYQRKLQRGVLSAKGDYLIVDLGPAMEHAPNGRFVPCRSTNACNESIESFVATCPKASRFEQWVFLQGWRKGEEWAIRNSDTQKWAFLLSHNVSLLWRELYPVVAAGIPQRSRRDRQALL